MANITRLQMWKNICNDGRIGIKKSFFGLKITATFMPTSSIIDVQTLEYTQSDGEKLRHILTSPRDRLSVTAGDFRPKPIVNGNYMAEICTSRDGQFACVQLLQFSVLNYEPVTDVLFFEGDEAKAVAGLF